VNEETPAARHNGAKIRRINPDNAPDESTATTPKRAGPPSPIEEPGKASSAVRNVSAEVHKALAVNDAERMAAARVLGAELTAIVADCCRTILAIQGMVISDSDLDKILSEKVTAGMRVVKAKHGFVVRPRKLPRVVAIAYGLGGTVSSAYERLAAIQTAWPFLFALATVVSNTVMIAKGLTDKAAIAPKAPPIEVVQEPPSMVDAREDN